MTNANEETQNELEENETRQLRETNQDRLSSLEESQELTDLEEEEEKKVDLEAPKSSKRLSGTTSNRIGAI